jgi:hypothetical protein
MSFELTVSDNKKLTWKFWKQFPYASVILGESMDLNSPALTAALQAGFEQSRREGCFRTFIYFRNLSKLDLPILLEKHNFRPGICFFLEAEVDRNHIWTGYEYLADLFSQSETKSVLIMSLCGDRQEQAAYLGLLAE